TAAAFLGLECDVYMGAEDARRQRLNVIRMRMLGARVIEVDAGSRTLKDATNEAMRDWMASSDSTHYILGSVVGPHPFPMIVRDFQSVIGREVVEQVGMGGRHRGTEAQRHRGGEAGGEPPARAHSQWSGAGSQEPRAIVACVGGGSNAAGIFYPFIDTDVRLIGVEAGGRGRGAGEHAAPLCRGEPGILHGSLSYVLQDAEGQTAPVHSCSAGLDYPGVGPEHAYWKDAGRVEYQSVTDAEALEAFTLLARTEGILPALESAHAIAHAVKVGRELPREARIIICLSGRGDKDVDEAAR